MSEALKNKWIAKVKEKNKVYAIYPSIKQASIENLIDVPSLQMCLRDYVPDSNGFYYRYCDNVEIWLKPLDNEKALK